MLDRQTILELFEALNAELTKAGVAGDLFLVGGAAMCLAYDARGSTKDVDAMFKPSRSVRKAAARVGLARGIGESWLNDAVKGYLSDRGAFAEFIELSNLRVSVAQADYLLAMKCLAMRIGEEFQDIDDVRFLLRLLDVESYEHAIELIGRYYPLDRFPQKTLYVLEELLVQSQNDNNPVFLR